jgi:hypothetical protein
MTDEVVTGSGPGEGYVSFNGIAGITVYLIVLTFGPMFGLMWLWPSCEAPSETATSPSVLTVSSIAPSIGKMAGGEPVTIRGAGFAEGATVSFDGAAAVDVRFVSPRTLTARTPAHKAERVDVVVTNLDKKRQTLSGGFIYTDPQAVPVKLSVTSLTPTTGPLTGGQAVTISGSGFSSVTTVSFGSVPATDVVVVNDNTLTALTPVHAEGKVDVVVGNGSSATLSGSYSYTCWGAVPYRLFLMVLLAGALGGALHGLRSLFWYVGNRDLRSSWLLMYFLLPVSGAAIAVIFYLVAFAGLYTVQGTGSFLLVGLAALVGMFSPQAAEKLKKIAEGLLTNAPQGANTVAPQPAAGTTAALTVASVAPAAGSAAGGTPATITGTGFASGATVTFGGTPATNVTVPSSTSITAITPKHVVGKVDVVVTNAGGKSAALGNGYSYDAPPRPTIASLTPNSGPAAGAQSVTITGTGLTNVRSVTFGGVPAADVRPLNDTTVTLRTPPHAAGTVEIVVGDAPDSAVHPAGYTYT